MIFQVHFSKCRAGFYMAHHIYDTNIEHVVLFKRFIIMYITRLSGITNQPFKHVKRNVKRKMDECRAHLVM